LDVSGDSDTGGFSTCNFNYTSGGSDIECGESIDPFENATAIKKGGERDTGASTGGMLQFAAGQAASYTIDVGAFTGENAVLYQVVEAANNAGAAEEAIVRNNNGIWGLDEDGDGWSDDWFGGFVQGTLGFGSRYGKATLPNDRILQPGDLPTRSGLSGHDALNAGKNEASTLIAQTASDGAIEAATGGLGFLGKVDDVNDLRKAKGQFQTARKGAQAVVPKVTAKVFATAKVVTEAAKKLGFRKTNFRSHGQPVFTDGKIFITPDRTGHIGGVWKAAKKVEDLGNNTTRLGTYDQFLKWIGK